jgi:hypothetical protein
LKIVVSQSMFFPWVGFLEQIKLADIFVYYDDVPFSKGSFTNRVQLKGLQGPSWLTVPLKKVKLGETIEQISVKDKELWHSKHLSLLYNCYHRCVYYKDLEQVVEGVYDANHATLASLSRASMMAILNYFNLQNSCEFLDVRDLGITGKGSQRVLEIVKALNGTSYITGLGARNYLDHDSFERQGIRVEYMDYQNIPYQQQFASFTPYVSALDLIANCGRQGCEFIKGEATYWKLFLNSEVQVSK